MNDKSPALQRLRAAVALVLVALYIAGLIAMFASNVRLALILWVVSTLGGIGLLYWLHTLKKRDGDAAGQSGGDEKTAGEQ